MNVFTVKRRMPRSLATLRASVVAASLVAVIAGCAVNPATGGRMLSLVSESQEIEMGRSYSQQIEASTPLVDDPALQSYVETIGLRLAATSERPQLPWSIKVVDDHSVNAFALPGGFLYVTRGILAHFNSEAELAAVLGHEVGHVTARHSVEQMSRQTLLGGLLVGASIFSEDVRNVSGVGAAAIGVFGLSHSRSDEHQADMLGVRYALRDQYDPREAVRVHEMLGRQTELRGGRGIPNWLATHPSSADRISRIQSQVDTIPATALAGTRVNRPDYLSAIDGLKFGPDPRQGFFQDERFLHPDLEFEFRLPAGWQTANLTQAVVAQSPDEDAITQLTLSSEAGHAAASQAFFSQDGLRGRGVSSTTVNGYPATIGSFEAATDNGTVSGIAGFIDYDGRTYQILGYTSLSRFGTYDNTFRSVISSFDRLTDAAALAVQPLRIDVLTLQRATTLSAMAASRPLPITPDELAIMNGIDLETPLSAGDRVKWVVGTLPPTGS